MIFNEYFFSSMVFNEFVYKLKNVSFGYDAERDN
jgi:hypothetical protein